MLRKEDLKFKGKFTDENGVTHYQLVHTPGSTKCPFCGSTDVHINTKPKRFITSLDPEFNKVIFEVQFNRFQCYDCTKTWYVPFLEERKKCTPEFENYVAVNVLDYGESIKGLSVALDVSFTFIRNIVNEELDRREAKQFYILPERILLHQIKLKGKDIYMLMDLQMATLLDMLTFEELQTLKDKENVKVVYARNPKALKAAEECFPGVPVKSFSPSPFSSGLEALTNEGIKAGLDGDLLKQYFEKKDSSALPELSKQSIKIIPLKIAYDFLVENSTDLEALSHYDGELDGFREFTESLKDHELPDGFLQEGVDLLCQGIEDIEKEITQYVGGKRSLETTRKMVLFPKSAYYPFQFIPLEKNLNFGRPIIDRKKLQQTEDQPQEKV